MRALSASSQPVASASEKPAARSAATFSRYIGSTVLSGPVARKTSAPVASSWASSTRSEARSSSTGVVRSMGCSVTASGRGHEALELARTLRPRLLLLDVLMPGIDGTELCQTLRGDTALSALPIILLSAMGNRLEQVADQAGATDCLAKPLTLGAIKAVVEKYLAKHS